MSVDSIATWTEALNFQFNGQHPPILGLIMRAVIEVFGNRVEYFTFLQASALYLSALFLLRQLCQARAFFFAATALALYPPAWIYSVTLWKDVWMAIFGCMTALFLIRTLESGRRLDLLLLFISLSLTVAIRHNSILIAATVVGIFFWKAWSQRSKRSFFIGLSLCLSILPSSLLNKTLNTNPEKFKTLIYRSLYAGWVSTHHKLGKSPDPEAVSVWNKALDSSDAFDRLVNRKDKCGDEWAYIMDPAFNRKHEDRTFTEMGGVFYLLKNFALRHPSTVLSHHTCDLIRLLDGKGSTHYYYHWGVVPNELGIVSEPKLPAFRTAFLKVADRLFWIGFGRHFLFAGFLIAFLFVAIFRGRCKIQRFALMTGMPRSAYYALPLMGLTYLFSFFLVPSATDWRYLFYLSLTSTLTLLASIANWLIKGTEAEKAN